MTRNRVQISSAKQKKLMAESFGKCSLSYCSVTSNLQIHHIDRKPSNNDLTNLIVLCRNHHAEADDGTITNEECQIHKQRSANLYKVMPSLLSAFDNILEHRQSEKLLFQRATSAVKPKGYQVPDLKYEFTKEGPIVYGNMTELSVSESNALLDRYFDHIRYFIKQEKRRQKKKKADSIMASHFLSVLRAFKETYNRIPAEEEMKSLNTELSRKVDLFYRFVLLFIIEVFHPDPPQYILIERK